MLLQIMEEGHLSDARGRTVDFRNALIIMTSNIGAEMIRKSPSLGFGLPAAGEGKEAQQDYETMRKTLMDQLRHAFRPEFLNRLDAVIVFRALNEDDIAKIVDLRLDEVRQRVLEHAITLEATDAAKNFLAREGFDAEYGARPLRRVITNLVEDRLSDFILSGQYTLGGTVLIDYDEQAGELTFREVEPENAGEPEPSA